ncbi:MAG: TetR/AcrR family transcriptional regulator, partial [Tannerella sp.]|nr:TetR/AcrR family transcriptional regulator [Tannerella sp.]
MILKEKSTEQTILEAAEYEFLEKGFDAAKTTKIASLAG